MKRSLLLVALLSTLPISLTAENRAHQQGTIVRMRMTDCMGSQHVFMDALAGGNKVATGDQCPEYVLVTETVVYVISGKNSNQLLPLAETTWFHFQNKEVVIRVDDARRESRFHVKEMVLRPEWERNQQIIDAAAVAAMHRHLEDAVLEDARQ